MDGDIELEITAGSGRGDYTGRVVHAPAGGQSHGRLQLDVDEVLGRLAELESTVLASAVPARRSVPFAEQPLRQVGQQLFDALFTKEIYGTYRASLGAAQHNGQQLRVVLRFGAPELAALPWEMLFDPETESYLCRTEPLLRQVLTPDYHVKPLEVVPPLRILGIISAPKDQPALNVDAEKQRLAEALAGPVEDGLVELSWAARATWDGVQAKLLAGPWHVVHFIGHGDYDAYADEGRVALVGHDGRTAMVEATRLVDLLSIAKPTPRLVVLNSCSSGQTSEQDLFSGSAAALVRSGINAVAAMQFTVSDNAAIAFAQGFYTALAYGRGIDEALRSARIAILGATKGTLEWVTPVLYVRGGATQLFTLTAAPRPIRHQQPPRSSEPHSGAMDRGQLELRDLYVRASAELRTKRYESALENFDELLSIDPEYRDAAALREKARLRQEIAALYRDARIAEEAEDLVTAARGYARVQSHPVFGDGSFADAASCHQSCEIKQRGVDLQAELRYYAASLDWSAVLDVNGELIELDPGAADPDRLATRARLEIFYRDAVRADDAGNPTAAGHALAEIVRIDPTFRDAFGPFPRWLRRVFTYPAEIVDGGLASIYHMPLLGTAWTATYQVVNSRETLVGELVCEWGTGHEYANKTQAFHDGSRQPGDDSEGRTT